MTATSVAVLDSPETSVREIGPAIDTVVLDGLVAWPDVLESAAWHVDAGSLRESGDGLRDLTGNGRDVVFASGGTNPSPSTPVPLPWSGEDYIRKPATTPTSRAIEAGNRVGVPAGGTHRIEWELFLHSAPSGWNSLWYTGNPATIYGYDTRKLRIVFGGSSVANSTWAVPVQERGVLAIESDATTWTIYWNGVEVESGTFSTPGAFAGIIGSYSTIDGPYSGWDFDLYSFRTYVNGALSHELVPSNATGHSTITNTGSAGGNWTITRAASGLRIALVDRPLVLGGNGGAIQEVVASSMPVATKVIALRAPATPGKVVNGVFLADSGSENNAGGGLMVSSTLGWMGRTGIQPGPASHTMSVSHPVVAEYAVAQTLDADRNAVNVNGTHKELVLAPGTTVLPPIATGRVSVMGYPASPASDYGMPGEFIAAASWDRVLSNEEIALAGETLLGRPRVEDRRETAVREVGTVLETVVLPSGETTVIEVELPETPDVTPDETWSREELVAYLADLGVTGVDLPSMSDSEILALVIDILDWP